MRRLELDEPLVEFDLADTCELGSQPQRHIVADHGACLDEAMLIPRQMRKTICNESFDLVRYGEVIVFAGQSQGSLRITAANVDKEGGDLLEKKRVAPCFPQ